MLIKKSRIPIKRLILYGFLPSFLKKLIYKLKGYKIGKNVSFSIGSVIIGENVVIGDNTSIGFFTVIQAKKIKIGRYVTIGSFAYIDTEDLEIGEDSKIREHVYVAGLTTPESKLKLGKRCSILQYSFLNPTKPIIFGDDSGIGGCCQVFTHGSYLSKLEGHPVTFAPITIGNNVWIPWNVFILPGVVIGDNVVIGASSLITRNIPSNCIAAGNPAKIKVKNFPLPVTEDEKKEILNNILKEFISYLKYLDKKVEKKESANGILTLIIADKHQLIYCEKYSQITDLLYKDNVLIINDKININDIYKNNNKIKMIISIPNKQRIGSSDIGEEFYRFLSRYGIRCDRLD
jgi:acetyltransferase-like isoleucine patch superfamily enzyme